MFLEFFGEGLAGFVAFDEDHEGFDDDAADALGVGGADDGTLGDSGMLDEGRFDFEGSDAVAAGFDDVVIAADEPEVAVVVLVALVSCIVIVASEDTLHDVFVFPIFFEEAWWADVADVEGDVAGLAGLELVALIVHDPDVVAGCGFADAAVLDGHEGVVGEDADGLGLAIEVVNLEAEGLFPDADDLGVHGFACTHAVAELEVVFAEVHLDEHTIDSGWSAEGGDAVFFHHAQEPVRIETAGRLPLDNGGADDHLAE